MRPGPVLVLAGVAVAGALVVEARNGPDAALTALLIIAGILLALVVTPAMGRRWPGEPAPVRHPHGTQLADFAQTPEQLDATGRRRPPPR